MAYPGRIQSEGTKAANAHQFYKAICKKWATIRSPKKEERMKGKVVLDHQPKHPARTISTLPENSYMPKCLCIPA